MGNWAGQPEQMHKIGAGGGGLFGQDSTWGGWAVSGSTFHERVAFTVALQGPLWVSNLLEEITCLLTHTT